MNTQLHPIDFETWERRQYFYYFPILQAGRFFEKEGRKMMPFSITVHHAVADGYHVGLFLEKFQECMNHPDQWIRL